jgi:hypothetical protein
MLLSLLSLAISLLSVQVLFPSPQQAPKSNQSSQTQKVQKENKASQDSSYVINQTGRISVTPVPLPPGDSAWAVQIVTGGGFTGKGRGNLTLTSDGTLLQDGPNGSCSMKLPDETMKALTEAVFAINVTHNTEELTNKYVCADCIVTAMVVTRRKTEVNETISASWDDGTQAHVAADMLNIYQAVMANKDCKLQ